MHETANLHVIDTHELIAPASLSYAIPLTDTAAHTVYNGREIVKNILHGNDSRLLVVIGPCSIHDAALAREYAARLSAVQAQLQDALALFMRVYFEKPRTTVGWKGLINDPHLDDSFEINEGLHIARHLLIDLNEMGIPCATEFLDPITPAYMAELVSWGAIGARTTESQTHRELASGLSCPVGFKNGTDGNVQIAIDACRAASHHHHFLGVTREGRSAIIATGGNPDCHVILRGGQHGPNYQSAQIDTIAKALQAAGLAPRAMVDCSHANSGKDHERQAQVALEIATAIGAGENRIIGVMLESHLKPGRQDLKPGRPLAHGISITDACMGWEASVPVLEALAAAARKRRTA